MAAFVKKIGQAASLLASAVTALDGIVAPDTIDVGQATDITFQNADSDQYRVYLAAALAGSNGPSCYLINSTKLLDSVEILIPADVGPSAGYYTIAIADITAGQGATYSNRFNLTGATGRYSDYENHLGGSPFWDADSLPCTAYPCARQCADASYPGDLTVTSTYDTMRNCILECDGVTPAASQTTPAHASTTASATVGVGDMAVMTLGSSVVTAIETERVQDGRTITEAIIGDQTVTLDGASHTVADVGVSLATDGVQVGGSTVVEFTSVTSTAGPTTTGDIAAAVTTTGGAPSRSYRHIAGAAGVGLAGLAVML